MSQSATTLLAASQIDYQTLLVDISTALVKDISTMFVSNPLLLAEFDTKNLQSPKNMNAIAKMLHDKGLLQTLPNTSALLEEKNFSVDSLDSFFRNTPTDVTARLLNAGVLFANSKESDGYKSLKNEPSVLGYAASLGVALKAEVYSFKLTQPVKAVDATSYSLGLLDANGVQQFAGYAAQKTSSGMTYYVNPAIVPDPKKPNVFQSYTFVNGSLYPIDLDASGKPVIFNKVQSVYDDTQGITKFTSLSDLGGSINGIMNAIQDAFSIDKESDKEVSAILNIFKGVGNSLTALPTEAIAKLDQLAFGGALSSAIASGGNGAKWDAVIPSAMDMWSKADNAGKNLIISSVSDVAGGMFSTVMQDAFGMVLDATTLSTNISGALNSLHGLKGTVDTFNKNRKDFNSGNYEFLGYTKQAAYFGIKYYTDENGKMFTPIPEVDKDGKTKYDEKGEIIYTKKLKEIQSDGKTPAFPLLSETLGAVETPDGDTVNLNKEYHMQRMQSCVGFFAKLFNAITTVVTLVSAVYPPLQAVAATLNAINGPLQATATGAIYTINAAQHGQTAQAIGGGMLTAYAGSQLKKSVLEANSPTEVPQESIVAKAQSDETVLGAQTQSTRGAGSSPNNFSNRLKTNNNTPVTTTPVVTTPVNNNSAGSTPTSSNPVLDLLKNLTTTDNSTTPPANLETQSNTTPPASDGVPTTTTPPASDGNTTTTTPPASDATPNQTITDTTVNYTPAAIKTSSQSVTYVAPNTKTLSSTGIDALVQKKNTLQNQFVAALDSIDIYDGDSPDGGEIYFGSRRYDQTLDRPSFIEAMTKSRSGVGGVESNGILGIPLYTDGKITGFDIVTEQQQKDFTAVYAKCVANMSLTEEDITTMDTMQKMCVFDYDLTEELNTTVGTLKINEKNYNVYPLMEGKNVKYSNKVYGTPIESDGNNVKVADYAKQFKDINAQIAAVPDSLEKTVSKRNQMADSITKALDSILVEKGTGENLSELTFDNNGHRYVGFEAFLYGHYYSNTTSGIVNGYNDEWLTTQQMADYVWTYNKLKNHEDLTDVDLHRLNEMMNLRLYNGSNMQYYNVMGGDGATSYIKGVNLRDGNAVGGAVEKPYDIMKKLNQDVLDVKNVSYTSYTDRATKLQKELDKIKVGDVTGFANIIAGDKTIEYGEKVPYAKMSAADKLRFQAAYDAIKEGTPLTAENIEALKDMKTLTVTISGTKHHIMDGKYESANLRDSAIISNVLIGNVDPFDLATTELRDVQNILTRGFDNIRVNGYDSVWTNNNHRYTGFEAFLRNDIEIGTKHIEVNGALRNITDLVPNRIDAYLHVHNKMKTGEILNEQDFIYLKEMTNIVVRKTGYDDAHVMDGGYTGGLNLRNDGYVDRLKEKQNTVSLYDSNTLATEKNATIEKIKGDLKAFKYAEKGLSDFLDGVEVTRLKFGSSTTGIDEVKRTEFTTLIKKITDKKNGVELALTEAELKTLEDLRTLTYTDPKGKVHHIMDGTDNGGVNIRDNNNIKHLQSLSNIKGDATSMKNKFKEWQTENAHKAFAAGLDSIRLPHILENFITKEGRELTEKDKDGKDAKIYTKYANSDFAKKNTAYTGFKAILAQCDNGTLKYGSGQNVTEQDKKDMAAVYDKLVQGKNLTDAGEVQTLKKMKTLVILKDGKTYHIMDGSCTGGLNLRDGEYYKKIDEAKVENFLNAGNDQKSVDTTIMPKLVLPLSIKFGDDYIKQLNGVDTTQVAAAITKLEAIKVFDAQSFAYDGKAYSTEDWYLSRGGVDYTVKATKALQANSNDPQAKFYLNNLASDLYAKEVVLQKLLKQAYVDNIAALNSDISTTLGEGQQLATLIAAQTAAQTKVDGKGTRTSTFVNSKIVEKQGQLTIIQDGNTTAFNNWQNAKKSLVFTKMSINDPVNYPITKEEEAAYRSDYNTMVKNNPTTISLDQAQKNRQTLIDITLPSLKNAKINLDLELTSANGEVSRIEKVKIGYDANISKYTAFKNAQGVKNSLDEAQLVKDKWYRYYEMRVFNLMAINDATTDSTKKVTITVAEETAFRQKYNTEKSKPGYIALGYTELVSQKADIEPFYLTTMAAYNALDPSYAKRESDYNALNPSYAKCKSDYDAITPPWDSIEKDWNALKPNYATALLDAQGVVGKKQISINNVVLAIANTKTKINDNTNHPLTPEEKTEYNKQTTAQKDAITKIPLIDFAVSKADEQITNTWNVLQTRGYDGKTFSNVNTLIGGIGNLQNEYTTVKGLEDARDIAKNAVTNFRKNATFTKVDFNAGNFTTLDWSTSAKLITSIDTKIAALNQVSDSVFIKELNDLKNAINNHKNTDPAVSQQNIVNIKAMIADTHAQIKSCKTALPDDKSISAIAQYSGSLNTNATKYKTTISSAALGVLRDDLDEVNSTVSMLSSEKLAELNDDLAVVKGMYKLVNGKEWDEKDTTDALPFADSLRSITESIAAAKNTTQTTSSQTPEGQTTSGQTSSSVPENVVLAGANVSNTAKYYTIGSKYYFIETKPSSTEKTGTLFECEIDSNGEPKIAVTCTAEAKLNAPVKTPTSGSATTGEFTIDGVNYVKYKPEIANKPNIYIGSNGKCYEIVGNGVSAYNATEQNLFASKAAPIKIVPEVKLTFTQYNSTTGELLESGTNKRYTPQIGANILNSVAYIPQPALKDVDGKAMKGADGVALTYYKDHTGNFFKKDKTTNELIPLDSKNGKPVYIKVQRYVDFTPENKVAVISGGTGTFKSSDSTITYAKVAQTDYYKDSTGKFYRYDGDSSLIQLKGSTTPEMTTYYTEDTDTASDGSSGGGAADARTIYERVNNAINDTAVARAALLDAFAKKPTLENQQNVKDDLKTLEEHKAVILQEIKQCVALVGDPTIKAEDKQIISGNVTDLKKALDKIDAVEQNIKAKITDAQKVKPQTTEETAGLTAMADGVTKVLDVNEKSSGVLEALGKFIGMLKGKAEALVNNLATLKDMETQVTTAQTVTPFKVTDTTSISTTTTPSSSTNLTAGVGM